MISAYIEALIVSKASILSERCKGKQCYCLYLQETHIAFINPRLKIEGIALVAECPHNKYGSALFLKPDLKMNNVSVAQSHTGVGLLQTSA